MQTVAKTVSQPANRHPGEGRDPCDVTARKVSQKSTPLHDPMDSGLRRNDRDGGANLDQDRLAHAKNFANELNESRLWKIKISYQKRWTKPKRAQKAVEIQTYRPWTKSSGPKTAAGKLRSGGNADQGGRARKPMLMALASQKRFIQAVERLARARNRGETIPAEHYMAVTRMGQAASRALNLALAESLGIPDCNRAQQ
jgi:hypothetical protein